MENEISMEQRLNRIEQLLAGQKNVLTFDEACTYTGISRTYMYKLTCGSRIPHYKPNGKLVYFNRKELCEWAMRNQVQTVGQPATITGEKI